MPSCDRQWHSRAERSTSNKFVAAYRQYCWPVESLDDLKLAPFHLLATEGKSTPTRTTSGTWRHWRSLQAGPGAAAGDALQGRRCDRSGQRGEGIEWWTELTGRGGEGMVVKPFDFILQGQKGLTQPAVKCRGRDTCGSSTARLHRSETWIACGVGAWHKAVAGAARICAGDRRPGAVRPQGTAAASPRMRLRRAGPGKRTGRSAVVTVDAGKRWFRAFLIVRRGCQRRVDR